MTGDRQPLYEARNISKSYGSILALDDVSVRLYPGEVHGLVGDNGASKSTLVKVLSGVHNPDSGQLRLDGVEHHWKSPHDTIEAGVETLYQDSGLAQDLTIGSNVFLGREKPKPGLLGKLGFLAQKWRRKRSPTSSAAASPSRRPSAPSPSYPEASGKPSRSGEPSPRTARSSSSTSRPTTSAPVRPSKCSR